MNSRSAILFYAFIFLSSIATGITMLAIPYHFASNNYSSSFNIAYAIVMVLSLFFSYYCGILLDKYNRKKIIVWSYLVVALLSISTYFQEVNQYFLILIFALSFFIYQLHWTATISIIRDSFMPKKHFWALLILYIIEPITTLLSSYLGLLLIEGSLDNPVPIITWKLPTQIEPITIYELITISGFVGLASITLLAFMKYKKRNNVRDSESQSTMFSTGFNYLFSTKKLFLSIMLMYTLFVIILIERLSLSATFIKNTLDEGVNVLSDSEMYYKYGGIGFILIIILTIFLPNFIKSKTNLFNSIAGILLFSSLLFLSLFFFQSITLFLAFSFLIGVLNYITKIFRTLYLFKIISNNYFARSISIFNSSTILIRLIIVLVFSMTFFHKDNNIVFAYGILGIIALSGSVALYLLNIRVKRF